jgi:hypothetical protein
VQRGGERADRGERVQAPVGAAAQQRGGVERRQLEGGGEDGAGDGLRLLERREAGDVAQHPRGGRLGGRAALGREAL